MSRPFAQSIIIPVFKEVETIQEILEKVFQENIQRNQQVLNNEFINNPSKLKYALRDSEFEKNEVLELLKKV